MRLLYTFYIAITISIISCAGDTKKVPESVPVIDSYLRYCQTEYTKNQQNEIQRNKEYYLDNEPTDSVAIAAIMSEGLVKHYYQLLKREPIEIKEKTPSEDGIKQANFKFVYKHYAFTPDYMDTHKVVPEVMELNIDHYSVAFLNVMSRPADDFQVVIYDIDKGDKLHSRSSSGFSGDYYLGNRIDTSSLDKMRCVVKLGDNFAIKEFRYSDVRK